MINEIITELAMDKSYESDWFPLELDPISNFGKRASAESMQISWSGVTGTYNGVIEILASNDMTNYTCGATVAVNTAENQSDSVMIIFLSVFRFIKIRYTKNSISGGKLNVSLNYTD
ncbi:MAG: hypothetical protein WCT77_07590 [Bacteroidota bacterium]|jgi:hypothetical protein